MDVRRRGCALAGPWSAGGAQHAARRARGSTHPRVSAACAHPVAGRARRAPAPGFASLMRIAAFVLLLLAGATALRAQAAEQRPRAREAGVIVGILPTGALNAITDVPGVRVGHTTVHEGDTIHTGVTAILPHAGNLFEDRVPAALHVGNGFGKLTGVTQLRELGEL